MKKYIVIMAAAMIAGASLSACSSPAANNPAASSPVASKPTEPSSADIVKEKQIKIVTTIFPEYDWVKEILGDHAGNAEITMLLDNGVDLHSYQSTAEDIMKISDCDLFIYVGGESDGWVDDALQEAANKDRKVINLLDVLGDHVKEEELVEGMEAGEHEHEHDHENETYDHEEKHEHSHEDGADHEEEHGHEHEEGPEYDEHVWLSLKNAQVLCGAISDALVEIDPDNTQDYRENEAAYNDKLASLDAEYHAVTSAAAQKTLLFGDRFPFRYLVDDYGLSYKAAFAGCSAETEASFETIAYLAGKVDELGLNSVLTIEKSDQKIANTIIQNTQNKNQKILTLDSMQSKTSKDVSDGVTYLSVMESNLAILKEALN